MAYTRFTVDFVLKGDISEALFKDAIVAGMLEGSLNHLSWLHSVMQSVSVLAYEEPEQDQEWEVLVQDHDAWILGTFGFRGKRAEAIKAALDAYPTGKYTTARIKPE